MKLFEFIETGDFTGYYNLPTETTSAILEGSMKQPSNIIRLNDGEYLSHLSVLLEPAEWSSSLLDSWFSDYLKYINILDYISPSQYNTLFNYFNSSALKMQLLNPSIAYLTRNDGTITDYPYDDMFYTGEFSLGLNTYTIDIIYNYGRYITTDSTLRNIILSNHIDINNCFASNLCKVTYNGQSEYVYCFDGILYENYTLDESTHYFSTGGGNRFGEVKFAGNKIQAHYKVRKNISSIDPTVGMCSGYPKPFCMGDQIYIIDTTCYTSNTTEWTWVGDFTTISRVMHISDVTNPCFDYRNVPIADQLFPLRIIQFCKFDNFL